MKRNLVLILPAIISVLLTTPSAHALPQPDDIVGVHRYDGIMANQQSKYFKKWKELTLDPSTRSALVKMCQKLESEGYREKFKVQFLFIGEGELSRVFFLGDSGTVLMMDWPGGQRCMLRFDSDSGYAGLQGQACE